MGKKRKGRRSKGEGTLSQQRNGRWKATRTINWRTRETESQTFDSHGEATAWLAQQRNVVEAATGDSEMLLADWIESWLADVKRDQATSTYQSYEYHLNAYVIPNLGSARIRDLKPLAFRNLFASLEKASCKAATRQKVYSALHACLGAATILEVIPRNPISKVSKPKHTRKDIDPFTVEEVHSILEGSKDDRLHGLYTLAFHLGLRQGELYALQWGDLDVEAKTLSIRRQVVCNRGVNEVKAPKTKAGVRTLELADETLEVLHERRKLAMKEKMAGNPLIFPGRRGAYLNRSSVAFRFWKPLLTKLKIRPRGMHHCRHTFASHALSNGEDVVTVSAILGHADSSITLRIYSHVVEKALRRTSERMAKLFSTTSELHPVSKFKSS